MAVNSSGRRNPRISDLLNGPFAIKAVTQRRLPYRDCANGSKGSSKRLPAKKPIYQAMTSPPEQPKADDHVDLVVGRDGEHSSKSRPWLGVRFECCQVYTRIYRNRAGTEYTGWCPRCGAAVRVPIGPAGTHARFFRAV